MCSYSTGMMRTPELPPCRPLPGCGPLPGCCSLPLLPGQLLPPLGAPLLLGAPVLLLGVPLLPLLWPQGPPQGAPRRPLPLPGGPHSRLYSRREPSSLSSGSGGGGSLSGYRLRERRKGGRFEGSAVLNGSQQLTCMDSHTSCRGGQVCVSDSELHGRALHHAPECRPPAPCSQRCSMLTCCSAPQPRTPARALRNGGDNNRWAQSRIQPQSTHNKPALCQARVLGPLSPLLDLRARGSPSLAAQALSHARAPGSPLLDLRSRGSTSIRKLSAKLEMMPMRTPK